LLARKRYSLEFRWSVGTRQTRARPQTLTGPRVGRKLARMANTREPSRQIYGPKSSSQSVPDPAVGELQKAIANGEEFLLATGLHARRFSADLEELRNVRLRRVGGTVFKRDRSRYWQIKYQVNGKWRYETTGIENRHEAERLLAFKVYEASAGLLPGTATFNQVIEHFLRDARSRELRSVARLERAAAQLLKKLDGYRAEKIDRARWLQYLDDRRREASADTVHLELSIARRAYKVARADGLVHAIPDIPQIRHLNVRTGFIDPRDWARVREHLRSELRDACDFAYACGPREMEVLALKWDALDEGSAVVNFHSTKTDRPRKVPYALLPQLREVIERRIAVRAQLERAGIISPWVFCFEQPVKIHGRVYHRAGDPLFKPTGERGLLSMLRANLDAACRLAKVPRLLFHDLRRSAARNLERAGVPRSVARLIGGWSDRMYSRYAIGAESELETALAQVGDYLGERGWHSGGTPEKNSTKKRGLMAEGGRSRTFRQAYCPPGRF
jgi:integrase